MSWVNSPLEGSCLLFLSKDAWFWNRAILSFSTQFKTTDPKGKDGVGLTVLAMVRNLHFPFLWPQESLGHLRQSHVSGLLAMQEVTCTRFLHDIRPWESRHLTESVVTVNNSTVLTWHWAMMNFLSVNNQTPHKMSVKSAWVIIWWEISWVSWQIGLRYCSDLFFFFLLSTIFYFFSHTTQHNIQKNKKKKTADTYSTSLGSIKRDREREGQQEHKSYSFK